MLLALVVGLNRWTHGFEVWTFEGRRQLMLQAGEVQALPVALRGADGRVARRWGRTEPASGAYLVDFVYTRCPSICRALGSEYQRMQRVLTGSRGAVSTSSAVHLVSISIDLEHDDPAQLARQAAAWGADPRHWTLAVPATPEDADALLRSLGVVVVPDGQGGFVHNGAVHLLDGRGRLRGLFEPEQWPAALEAAQGLAAMRPEGAG